MSWYVHRTLTGKEFAAAIALREYGYSCYVPWVENRTRRGPGQRAYFRGYIFCKDHIVREDHREAIVCNVFGKLQQMVLGAVSVGGKAMPIAEHLVARIAVEAARERTGDDAEPYAPRFKAGDIGIIREGPFKGFEVAIEAIDGSAARVALSIFNALHSIETSIENIGAAA
jgi:transcription antitermination factor NusG